VISLTVLSPHEAGPECLPGVPGNSPSLGLKAVKLTVSWINQIILQISTLVMADSKTRQYCIFQKYLPIAPTLNLHHLALINFSSWLLKKCKLSLMQSLELLGITNDAHTDECQQSGTSYMGTTSEGSWRGSIRNCHVSQKLYQTEPDCSRKELAIIHQWSLQNQDFLY